MKKKAYVFFLIMFLPAVWAEEEISAGITPDSFLYSVDRAFERLSIFLTFDDMARAEKHLVYANERLAEAEVMEAKGNLGLSEKLIIDYTEEIGKVSEIKTRLDAPKKAMIEQKIKDVLEKKNNLEAKGKEKSSNEQLEKTSSKPSSQFNEKKEKIGEEFNDKKEKAKKESDRIIDSMGDKLAEKATKKIFGKDKN